MKAKTVLLALLTLGIPVMGQSAFANQTQAGGPAPSLHAMLLPSIIRPQPLATPIVLKNAGVRCKSNGQCKSGSCRVLKNWPNKLKRCGPS